MKLYALSDLHLGHPANRRALETLPTLADDWLILAGDVGEKPAHLAFAFQSLAGRFKQLVWVPGNHELWSLPSDPTGARGVEVYRRSVALCQSFGVLTPEDPYPIWDGEGPTCLLAPMFLLYDYSFRPDHVPQRRAVEWAAEQGVLCADEKYLHADPYPSRRDWCEARCRETERRLERIPPGLPTVLINHFPLRRDLARLPRIPRFSIWCGTRRTEEWHVRFRARVVVSGHLHLRTTQWRNGVRFEEVSLGYPHQWHLQAGMRPYLREILPGPEGTNGRGGE